MGADLGRSMQAGGGEDGAELRRRLWRRRPGGHDAQVPLQQAVPLLQGQLPQDGGPQLVPHLLRLARRALRAQPDWQSDNAPGPVPKGTPGWALPAVWGLLLHTAPDNVWNYKYQVPEIATAGLSIRQGGGRGDQLRALWRPATREGARGDVHRAQNKRDECGP